MAVDTQYTSDYCSKIVKKHGDTIYKICRLYLKNQADAEDIFQQVFLKLIEKNPSFKDDNHEKSWLIRVTINRCKDFLKSYWPKHMVSFDEVEVSSDNKDFSELFSAVLSLESNYKIVIYMYYYESYSTSEIAKLLKINEATIRTRLKRARERLKSKLGGYYFYE